jgi:hypothetical protein
MRALAKAKQNTATATPVEQALIGALEQRFAGPEPLDPSNSGPRLAAYVAAMREVAGNFPDDNDTRVLLPKR